MKKKTVKKAIWLAVILLGLAIVGSLVWYYTRTDEMEDDYVKLKPDNLIMNWTVTSPRAADCDPGDLDLMYLNSPWIPYVNEADYNAVNLGERVQIFDSGEVVILQAEDTSD
jgi:hypothetical protein